MKAVPVAAAIIGNLNLLFCISPRLPASSLFSLLLVSKGFCERVLMCLGPDHVRSITLQNMGISAAARL